MKIYPLILKATVSISLCWISTTGVSAQVSLQTVAVSGDTAPGTGGALFQWFGRPAINEKGDLAFSSDLLEGTAGIGTVNKNGIWKRLADGAIINKIAQQGDLTSPYYVWGLISDSTHHTLRNPTLSGNGHVAFYSQMLAGNGTTRIDSIWRSTDNGKNWLVAGEGTRTPFRYGDNGFQTNTDTSGNRLGHDIITSPHFSPSGNVIFLGTLKNALSLYHGRWAAWFYPPRNDNWVTPDQLQSAFYLLKEEDPAPGIPGAVFQNISHLNTNGKDAVFGANLQPGLGGITDATKDSLWMFRNYTSLLPIPDLTFIARAGNTVPGNASGDVFYEFGVPYLNEAGQAVFWSSNVSPTDISAPPGVEEQVCFYEQGALQVLASSGHPAPNTAGATFKAFGDPAVGQNGEVAFQAYLSGTGVTSDTHQGIWSGSAGGNLTLLARSGAQAPGCPPGVLFEAFNQPQFNALGQMLFTATLQLSDSVTPQSNFGCWIMNKDGSLLKVLRTGETFEVLAGDHRIVSKINVSNLGDGGELALSTSFTNDTNAILQVTLPDDLRPSPPTTVEASWVTPQLIKVTWNEAVDDQGVAGYRLLRDDSLIATLGKDARTYEDGGLSSNTLYTYTLEAFDYRDNISDPSRPARVHTPLLAEELIVDNQNTGFTTPTGTWSSSSADDYYGMSSPGSIFSTEIGSTAIWTPTLSSTGIYQVYGWWSRERDGNTPINRDSAADYTVNHAGGSAVVTVDQDQNSGQWNLLGTYTFNSGSSGSVSLIHDDDAASHDGTDISTSADAIRWVRIEPQAYLSTVSHECAIQGRTFTLLIDSKEAHFQGGVTQVELRNGGQSIQALNSSATDDNQLTAQFFIPGNSPVGAWTLRVTTVVDGILTFESAFTVKDASADTNGDGINDLLEYAMGLEQKTRVDRLRHLPSIQSVEESDGKNYLHITYRQLKDETGSEGSGTIGVDYLIQGLTYCVEASTSLDDDWQSDASVVEYVPGSTIDNGDGTVSVTVKLREPIDTGILRFVRVKVTASP